MDADAEVQFGQRLRPPELREKFLLQGAEPVGRSSADTALFFKEEEARCRAVIRSANVRLD